jgi:hypothetical protein
MRRFVKIGFLAFVLVFSQNLAAQEQEEDVQVNKSLLTYYSTELFQWSYDFWGGLYLNYQNQSSRTMFGLKESMQKPFSLYEDTNQKFLSYKTNTLWGNIFFWSGYAVILSSPFILAYDNGRGDYYTLNATLGALGSGLIFMLIGNFLFTSGQENIFDAVNLYNRNKLAEYRN